MEKDKYIDNSEDKKYFAIIPYYIVNHSTTYEQSLYLTMKRIASEEGTCWASANELARRMAVSKNTVIKYRNKLVEREWIKKIGVRKIGQTNQCVNEYEIINLWKKNIEYIESKKVSKNDTLKVSTDDEKVSTVGTKEETVKKNKKEKTSSIVIEEDKLKAYGNPDINNLIRLLKERNNGFLDGSVGNNRQHCWHLLRKAGYKKDPVKAVATIKELIDDAFNDKFHSKNSTNFKYLFNNAIKISNQAEGNNNN